jgi:hypothetical protein
VGGGIKLKHWLEQKDGHTITAREDQTRRAKIVCALSDRGTHVVCRAAITTYGNSIEPVSVRLRLSVSKRISASTLP